MVPVAEVTNRAEDLVGSSNVLKLVVKMAREFDFADYMQLQCDMCVQVGTFFKKSQDLAGQGADPQSRLKADAACNYITLEETWKSYGAFQRSLSKVVAMEAGMATDSLEPMSSDLLSYSLREPLIALASVPDFMDCVSLRFVQLKEAVLQAIEAFEDASMGLHKPDSETSWKRGLSEDASLEQVALQAAASQGLHRQSKDGRAGQGSQGRIRERVRSQCRAI